MQHARTHTPILVPPTRRCVVSCIRQAVAALVLAPTFPTLVPPSRPWSLTCSPSVPPNTRNTIPSPSLPLPTPPPPHTQPPDPSAIAKVFAEIDTSADGKISEDEFIRFFADNSMEEMKRRVQTLHDDNKHAIVRCLEFPIGGLAQHGNGG